MKKILLCNLSYYPEVGGVENSIRSLREAYLKKGYHIKLLVGVKNKNDRLENSTDIDYFIRNLIKGRFGVILNPILTLIQIFHLFHKARKENYDICICRNQILSAIGLLFFKKKLIYVAPGFAFMQQNTNNLDNTFKRKISRFINKKLDYITLKYSYKIFVFSENMAKQAQYIYPSCKRKLFIVRPGVDTNRFTPSLPVEIRNNLKEKYKIAQNDILIICVGRLVKAKGFDYVINAMSILPYNYKCLIVGHGPEYEALNTAIERFKLQDRITIITDCSHPEKIYPLGHIFIMSSIYEPFGQTILEAMSCNLSIIAFNPSNEVVTATKEICGENAIYTELNHNSLAQAILSAPLNNKTRAFVKSNYSWDKLSSDLIS